MIVGGRDKAVHAIDAATGKAAWKFVTRARVDSSPAVAGGRVYVGSSDGKLYVLDAATGQKQWEFDAGDGHHRVAGDRRRPRGGRRAGRPASTVSADLPGPVSDHLAGTLGRVPRPAKN